MATARWGDTIPDGIWYGQIASIGSSSMELDVMCLYTGAVGEQMGQEFVAENSDSGSPPYWPGIGFLVNNSDRLRAVPLFVAADANQSALGHPNWPAIGDAEGCVPPLDPAIPNPTIENVWQVGLSWVLIEDGQARWSLTECPHD